VPGSTGVVVTTVSQVPPYGRSAKASVLLAVVLDCVTSAAVALGAVGEAWEQANWSRNKAPQIARDKFVMLSSAFCMGWGQVVEA